MFDLIVSSESMDRLNSLPRYANTTEVQNSLESKSRGMDLRMKGKVWARAIEFNTLPRYLFLFTIKPRYLFLFTTLSNKYIMEFIACICARVTCRNVTIDNKESSYLLSELN